MADNKDGGGRVQHLEQVVGDLALRHQEALEQNNRLLELLAKSGEKPAETLAADAPRKVREGHVWTFGREEPLVPGVQVPPGTAPPAGWQVIYLRDEPPQLWPKGKKAVPVATLTDAVDRQWEALTAKVMEFPQGRKPAVLAVNAAWRSHVPSVQAWNHAPVWTTPDTAFAEPASVPQAVLLAEDEIEGALNFESVERALKKRHPPKKGQ